ncbi:MAG: hypothetical protein IPJ28_11070 [Betaproteobacteria bacterium]|nr:hypothetical protein [Betaproteobacteria bacterium]
MIRELEEQRHQAVLARRSGATLPAPRFRHGPRAADQLMVSLTQAEAQVASLSARVGEYAARYEKLKASAALVPQLEAEYAQLNRDYDVNKRNFESLVARRESATISGDMQSVEGVADFRLVDPRACRPARSRPTASSCSRSRSWRPWRGRRGRPAGAAGAPHLPRSPLLRVKRPGCRSRRGLASVTAGDGAKKRQSHLRFAGAIAGLVGLYATTFVVLEVLSSRMA